MATIPFTLYTVKSESSKGVNVYLGVASKPDNRGNNTEYFPHQVVACKTTYLFASIVGTRNVKVTRPTTKDPYIYIETRGVAGQQCEGLEATSLLKSGSGSLVMRTVTSDSSIKFIDNGCNYGLTTFKYDVQNACSINGFYYRTMGVPGQTDVVWLFKGIVGDPPCINVTQENGIIGFSLNKGACC